MIRKIACLGVITLLISSMVSCEKDFTDIGTNVIENGAFNVGDSTFYLALKPSDIKEIQTDNITLSTSESRYLLGSYKNNDYKSVDASIITQLSLPSFRVKPGVDTVRVMDNAFIVMPYQATLNDGKYTLEGITGNTPETVSIKVYRNNTYLSRLNQLKPKESNEYFSNSSFEKLNDENIARTNTLKLSNKASDTMYVFQRFLTSTKQRNDTLKLANSIPFYTIPLNNDYFKTNVLDKVGTSYFESASNFNDYFRGLIIEAKSIDETKEGSLVSFNFSSQNAPNPALYMYYSDVVYKNSVIDTIIKREATLALSGIRAANYTAKSATNGTPTNAVAVQGTVGSQAKMDILTTEQVQNLRAKNWLINDASLTFYIDASKDTTQVPRKLFLYKEITKDNKVIATQIKDAYSEAALFGGDLQLDSNDKPEKYTIRITDYLSDVLKATSNEKIAPLSLKVYNPYTDSALKNNVLDTLVKTYNWMPNMVSILNGNTTVNGNKRAVLKISYSKEK